VPLRFAVGRGLGLVVRTAGDPAAITPSLRRVIRESDPTIALYDVNTMERVRELGFWQYGLFGSMFSIFGVIALLLAAIGVYGVISYSVSQRTQEIGVRVALGARRLDVMRLVVGQGMKLAGIGLGIGLVGALGITRVVRSLLFGVSPTDPLSFGLITIFLTAVAAVASWLPARRATAVDPIVALRRDERNGEGGETAELHCTFEIALALGAGGGLSRHDASRWCRSAIHRRPTDN
jgi:ABC-type antimicrobial peptide transport system permease subunit